MKVFLIAALALSLAINIYQLTFSPEAANLVIANSTQAECIKNLRSPSSEANVIGPEFFPDIKHSTLILTPTHPSIKKYPVVILTVT